jgi:uncharacterized protein (DUF488 family)
LGVPVPNSSSTPVRWRRHAGRAFPSEHGIAYLHLRGLGTPKEGRLAARSGRLDDLFRIYETHLATPQAQEELDGLIGLVKSGKRVCLLCYERDVAYCHRKRIAELVCERVGIDAEHIVVPLF